MGRPSVDPEPMIRMLIVGYSLGILCDEAHLNLAYRWFCRLGLDGDVPDHSTFSKNRHGRFRESDLLRKLFETLVARCIKERIVGGEAFAVDASIIVADAHRRRGVAKIEDLDPTSSRAVAEYLSVLDDAAFGGEMLFAHLKRILRLGRLRLRGPSGAKDEFLLAATAQNLRKLAKLIPLPAPIFAI